MDKDGNLLTGTENNTDGAGGEGEPANDPNLNHPQPPEGGEGGSGPEGGEPKPPELPEGFESVDDLKQAYEDLKGKAPEVPDEYALNVDDAYKDLVDEQASEEAKSLAKEIGLSQDQFDRLVQFDLKRTDSARNQSLEQINQGLDALKTEWGENWDQNLQAAKKVVNDFADDELKQTLKSDPMLGNHPGLLRFLSSIGQSLSEDSYAGPGQGGGSKGPRDAADVLYPSHGK